VILVGPKANGTHGSCQRRIRKPDQNKSAQSIQTGYLHLRYHRRESWSFKAQPTKSAHTDFRYTRRKSGEFQGPAYLRRVLGLLTVFRSSFETPPTAVDGILKRLECRCVGWILNSPPASARWYQSPAATRLSSRPHPWFCGKIP
jgi:hypothetical protein